MRSTLRFALLGVISCGAMLWHADLATAQVRVIIRPIVPAATTVRIVGEVDPTEPIDIVITNVLAVPLGIGFAGGANVEVAPDETAKLTFTTVPVNLFVYPLASGMSIRSRVTIEDNTISASVLPLTSVAPGDVTLNVDGSGTVYVY